MTGPGEGGEGTRGPARARMRLVQPLGVVHHDGLVVVAALPHGPAVVLDDIAALLVDLVDGRTPEEVAEAAAAMQGWELEQIAPDVARFCADLERQGVVETAPEP